MDNKGTGIYFMIFAVAYFIFTAFMVGHGIHFMNSAIAVGMLLGGAYFYFKDRIN